MIDWSSQAQSLHLLWKLFLYNQAYICADWHKDQKDTQTHTYICMCVCAALADLVIRW